MIATWSVHDQSRDQCMISHVIIAWQARDHCMIAKWSVSAQSHDKRLSVNDHCLINTWSVHDHSHDHCMISHGISAWSATWSVNDHPHDHCIGSHVISAWYPGDQRMISHMISAIKSRDHYMIVMWSVHAQSRYQCMISHVISALSVTWSLNNSTHDQWMIASR